MFNEYKEYCIKRDLKQSSIKVLHAFINEWLWKEGK